MSTDQTPELIRFQQFISDRLKCDESLSPEKALDLWRQSNPPPRDSDEEILAIRQALHDMERGDTGVPLEEFDRVIRRRFGFTP